MQEGKSEGNSVYYVIKHNMPILKGLMPHGVVSVYIVRDIGVYERYLVHLRRFPKMVACEMAAAEFDMSGRNVYRIIQRMEEVHK